MALYLNKGNAWFQAARRSEYVDKSGLIAVVNSTLFTDQRYSCVTRCRRFGKSMAAKMLAAYYDHTCDSRSLFTDLEIAGDMSFEEHLNKYPVIYLDMNDFYTRFKDSDDIVKRIDKEIREDMAEVYPQVPQKDDDDLMAFLLRVVYETKKPFFFIIDEWDVICREYAKPSTPYAQQPTVMDDYVNWLRRMFKSANGADCFAGVYITGILPIKKYKTESALNNFEEYSMVSPGDLAPYFGFTKDEVRMLAGRRGMDFDELEKWYDGYQIGPQLSMFNPNSVMMALRKKWCESYWGRTGATDAISGYIDMNYDCLKDDIIKMLAGDRCYVDPVGFKNDLSLILSRDDVLTVLIHLGYLSYDRRAQKCFVPNLEVSEELKNAVRDANWKNVYDALQRSRQLIDSTVAGDEKAVACALEAAHSDDTSILSYNDENSLACVISLAYYYANNDYHVHCEYATGKGFADLVMIPRKNVSKPALIIELKKDKDAETGIDQIKRRNYPQKVAEYTGEILLVGINYDADTKEHICRIEQWAK